MQEDNVTFTKWLKQENLNNNVQLINNNKI